MYTIARLMVFMHAFWYKRVENLLKGPVDIDILVTSRNGDRKIVQSIRIASRLPSRIRKNKEVKPVEPVQNKHLPK